MSALARDYDLDFFSREAQSLEEKLKEVLQVINRSHDAVVDFGICVSCGFRLFFIRRQTLEIRDRISELDVSNEGQRATAREIAARLGDLVRKFDRLHDITSTNAKCRAFIVRPAWTYISDILVELACITEDLAETLALSASIEFAEFVTNELREKEL